MTKPITKIASDATHGDSDAGSPAKYVNKMKAKTSTMIHEYWPKMQGHIEDGVKAAKQTAMMNTKPITEEDECGEGFQKNEAGECKPVTDGDNNLNDINTEGDTGAGSTELEVANQSGT